MRKYFYGAIALPLLLNIEAKAQTGCPTAESISDLVIESPNVKKFVEAIEEFGFTKASFKGDINANVMKDSNSADASRGFSMLQKSAGQITLVETANAEAKEMIAEETLEYKGPEEKYQEEGHEKERNCVYKLVNLELILSSDKESFATN